MRDMDSENEEKKVLIEKISQFLEKILYTADTSAVFPVELEPYPELKKALAQMMIIKSSYLALAKGELSAQILPGGYLAGALKTLQANLRHLTWQTQMIAGGDFTQRVDFMGEFSEAFNSMVSSLARAEEALRNSEERYRSLMMQSQDAVALFDLETLNIVESNPKFELMTGYNVSEGKPLNVLELFSDSQANVLQYLEQLRNTGVLPPTVRKILTSGGRTLLVERTASLVKAGGRSYQLIIFRDVSKEMDRQRKIQMDLTLASQVQRALLPVLPQSGYFHIETLFRPHGFVSGDVYHLEWRETEKVLRGFLIDITGHGMATALQTAAVNVLLHEVMDLPLTMSVSEQLVWLNLRISRYIDETSFAAAIAFELDFLVGELRYAAAGITDFLFNNMRISAPGLFLGINEKELFEAGKLSFSHEDSVCFMTDGISDVLNSDQAWGEISARTLCRLFGEEQQAEKLKDDAAAICITAKDPTRQASQKGLSG